MRELNRALDDHELVKVKIVGEKEVRNNLFLKMKDLPETEVIQKIGGVMLLYRPSKETNGRCYLVRMYSRARAQVHIARSSGM